MVSTKYMLMLLLPVALLLVGLCIAVWCDPYIRREHRRVMLVIIALILCLILQNLFEFHFALAAMPKERTVAAIIGYSVRPLILFMFFYIVSGRESHRVGWALVGINAAVHLTALFSQIKRIFRNRRLFFTS